MSHLYLFLTAAFLLAIVPGPGMLYVMGRTWSAGRGDGLASSLGTMLGGFVHVIACVVGVSALVMASATAFSVLKFAGGIYLIVLGVRAFLAASREEAAVPENFGRSGFWRALRQGAVVEATNPKTAAFFLAFIPQFISLTAGSVALQFLVLGTISVLLNTAADLVAVMAASVLHRRLTGRPMMFRRLRQGSGLLMASLGVGLLAARRG
ncbi:MAG TPA: LysE family translocator [Rhizomicrobium sp.]|jgi:threonine/homoserine/homoserine lactone efflux protein